VVGDGLVELVEELGGVEEGGPGTALVGAAPAGDVVESAAVAVEEGEAVGVTLAVVGEEVVEVSEGGVAGGFVGCGVDGGDEAAAFGFVGVEVEGGGAVAGVVSEVVGGGEVGGCGGFGGFAGEVEVGGGGEDGCGEW